MAKGLARQVRRAILVKLKTENDVTILVPAENIHPQATHKDTPWPFIKISSVSSVPLKATGIDGAIVRVTVYCYAKSTFNDAGAKTAEAEDNVDDIIHAVEASLDAKNLNLDDGLAKMHRVNTISRMDGQESDAFQGIVDFRASVIAR